MRHGSRMRVIVGRLPVVLLALAGAVGCSASSEVTGPDPASEIGVIDFYPAGVPTSDVITAPTVVRAGAEFRVSVRTYGGGCTSADGATVTYPSPSLAVVVPYDATHVPLGGGCTHVLRMLEHEVTLRFAVPGQATVRVEGRKEPGPGAAVVEMPISVTWP